MAEQVLEKIIALVRARPTITVRELARELGFSEERSVYYWLRKAGHKGLKSLKEQVVWAGPPSAVREEERRMAGDAAGPGGQAVRERPEERRPFTVVVSTRAYEPWIKAGDELYIDPAASPAGGDLVLVDLPGEGAALRRAYPGPSALWLVHPADPRDALELSPAPGQIRGVVLRLVRGRP